MSKSAIRVAIGGAAISAATVVFAHSPAAPSAGPTGS
jgi:hypothetical protein